jgi:phage shock protein PspC (stress-responsive transcriptional regulator)
MILGVSGWLGKKIGVKESVVRLAFLIGILFFGVGLLTYLICWLVKVLT